MKKATTIVPIIIVLGIFLFALISIYNQKKEDEKEEINLKYEKENSPALVLLIKEVENKYSDRNNNIITKEEFISELQSKYDSLLDSENLLKNSFFRLSSINKLSETSYLVSFKYDKYDYLYIKNFPNFSLDIRAILPKEQAKQLSKNKRYKLSGKNLTDKKMTQISSNSSDKYDFGIIILDSLKVLPD